MMSAINSMKFTERNWKNPEMNSHMEEDLALELLRQELGNHGMVIRYSERVGYFVIDKQSSETMMIIPSAKEFLTLVRKFNASQLQIIK
jgi:urease accessory protein UreE